jgi:8-oxo-dGTP pyrophosphatase MutT (NUDIX family)
MQVYVFLTGYRTFDNGSTTPVVLLSQKYGLPVRLAEIEGLFMPFGGKVELGESIENAALRELSEEIGDAWIDEHRLPGVGSPFGLSRRGKFADLGEFGGNHFLVLMVDAGLPAYRRLLRAVGDRHEGGAVAVPMHNFEALKTAIAPHILPAVERLFEVVAK